MRNELRILKIGGSVITDKTPGVFEKARIDIIERIAEEISILQENLILVHGAGSFGHPYVEKFNLRNAKNLKAVIMTHLACKRLNTIFCDLLFEKGVNVIPLHPLSCISVNEDVEIDGEFIKSLVDNGIVPVFHGDMVYNRLRDSFEVLSGDRIVLEIAKILNIRKIGFATDTEGLIVNGRVLEKAILNSELVELVGEADTKLDVTGGMRGKIESLIQLPENSEVLIFSGFEKGNILKFLKNEKVGTELKRG
ncbi:MAG TPA: isopentenyl phosphate kinase family protein [Archaeoglobaceae archaeon]|nr:isopentenyl phosphate kinase family protein [Archaeoglobaceae archaeon]